jgi:hypothetical protein
MSDLAGGHKSCCDHDCAGAYQEAGIEALQKPPAVQENNAIVRKATVESAETFAWLKPKCLINGVKKIPIVR